MVYQPKLIVIGFKSRLPDAVEFLQQLDLPLWFWSSLLSIIKMAQEKCCKLVWEIAENLIFVVKELFPLFYAQSRPIAGLICCREALEVLPKRVRRAGAPLDQNLFFCTAIDLLRKYQLRNWTASRGVDHGAGCI
jgi:hypothetical protein